MNIDYLQLITDFNNKLKLRKLNIDEVVEKMNQIENMLKLNYSMSMNPNKNKVFTIEDGKYKFNSCLFLYINHYEHLTNNKDDLRKIKEIGKKIMMKFINYLSNYEHMIELKLENEFKAILDMAKGINPKASLMFAIRNSVEIVDPEDYTDYDNEY